MGRDEAREEIKKLVFVGPLTAKFLQERFNRREWWFSDSFFRFLLQDELLTNCVSHLQDALYTLGLFEPTCHIKDCKALDVSVDSKRMYFFKENCYSQQEGKFILFPLEDSTELKFKNAEIAIVEDSEEDYDAIKEEIEKKLGNIIIGKQIKSTSEIISQNTKFKVWIVDLRFTEKNHVELRGHEAIRRIREGSKNWLLRPPIIVFTGYNSPFIHTMVKGLGADFVIFKGDKEPVHHHATVTSKGLEDLLWVITWILWVIRELIESLEKLKSSGTSSTQYIEAKRNLSRIITRLVPEVNDMFWSPWISRIQKIEAELSLIGEDVELWGWKEKVNNLIEIGREALGDV